MNTWEPTNGVNTGNQTWVCMGIRYGCEYNLYIQVESAVDVNTQESEKDVTIGELDMNTEALDIDVNIRNEI